MRAGARAGARVVASSAKSRRGPNGFGSETTTVPLDVDAMERFAARVLVAIPPDVFDPASPPDVFEPATPSNACSMKSTTVAQLCFVLPIEAGFAPALPGLVRVFDVRADLAPTCGPRAAARRADNHDSAAPSAPPRPLTP